MPNKVKRNSVVDLLAKVPVNRGSLLKSVENLLKTIERSESAVMIPTLLRDKCEFDAWELLFVAKILKASILGHSDLVEFYMNHMGHTASQLAAQANGAHNNQNDGLQQSTATTPLSPATGNGPIPSPGAFVAENGYQSSSQLQNGHHLATSPSLSSTSSISSVAAAGIGQSINGSQQQPLGNFNGNTSNRSQSSASWMTANQSQQTSGAGSITPASSSSGGSVNSSLGNETNHSVTFNNGNGASCAPPLDSSTTVLDSSPIQQQQQESILAARPLLMSRQAQPPSLLQLTTTNNHINSVAAVAAGFTNNNIEQLTQQLTSMQLQQNGCLSSGCTTSNSNQTFDGALSISTTTANQQSPTTGTTLVCAGNSGASLVGTISGSPDGRHAELRSSRSAGCLFRINSGASSPRTPAQTPTTPYPQAETLANGLSNGLAGDPSAPVKLLLQIEQLKSSISHVTNLLDSVVELYKKSIDNIAMA